MEPKHTVYLSQASDGAQHLGLLKKHELDSVLKLNLLFFDRIAIGSSDLLGNPLLFSLVNSEQNQISCLYEQNNNSGTLIPVLWESNESILEVAENMVRDKTAHSLESSNQLLAHADFINKHCKDYLYANENYFRERFYSELHSIFSYSSRMKTNSKGLIELDKTIYRDSLSWLENEYCNSGSIKCSDYYQFLDRSFSSNISNKMKYYGEAFYHFALSESLYVEFSSSERLVPLIELAKKKEKNAGEMSVNNLNYEISEIRFPINLIPSFSLSEIQKLRMLEPFKKVRDYLARYRGGYNIDVQIFINLLEECEPILLEFLSTNRYRREQYFNLKKNEYRRLKIATWYDMAYASSPIVLSFMYPDKIPITVASFFAVGFFTVKKIIDFPTSTNLAISTTFDTAINTVSGGIRNVTKNI